MHLPPVRWSQKVLQYIADDIRIKAVEADCMYAGIMIDTNKLCEQNWCEEPLRRQHF